MGKNSKFDREEVIDKAINLYWNSGFHGTSMRTLQNEIDMRPGSIYATFGSKEGLFKEALIRYTQLGREQLTECRRKADSPVNALKSFMIERVKLAQKASPTCMCLLVKSVAELTDNNAELLAQARESLKTMESGFEELIIAAQAAGEIDKTKDSKNLARHIQIYFSGLRSYIRVYGDTVPIAEMFDDLFQHYPFTLSSH